MCSYISIMGEKFVRILLSFCIFSCPLLQPNSATKITVNPTSPRVISGTNITMTCNSHQYREGYYFQKNDQRSLGSDNKWVASWSFTADPSKTGSYNCCGTKSHPNSCGNYQLHETCYTFTNKCGHKHHQLTVIPKTPVVYSTHRKPDIGDAITLTCDAETWTAPPAISYTFMRNSAAVHSGTVNTYTFSATERSTGSYSCTVVAGNVASSQSPTVPIDVRLPVTTPTPTTTPAPTRRPITFNCETGPSAVTDYQYRYDPAHYIHCETDGKAYIETCPAGTLWNQAARKCAAPSPSIG